MSTGVSAVMWEMLKKVQELHVKESTAKGRQTGRTAFEKFMMLMGVAEPFIKPVTDDYIAAFCVYGCVVKQWKVSTVKQYLQGVRAKHEDLGMHFLPLRQRVAVYRALRGLERIFGKHVSQKQAMTCEILLLLWAVMDFSDVNMVTLWAVMLVALFGMLRKDNVTVGKEGAFNPFRNLTREDFVRDGQLKVLWVIIKSAKTIQFFEREHRVPLVETGGTLCPPTNLDPCVYPVLTLCLALSRALPRQCWQ